jgi:tetratricopeptide (TPR) repeat protein
MTQIRQYDYTNTFQRKINALLTFLSSCIAGAFFSENIKLVFDLFPYREVFSLVGLIFLSMHILGYVCGHVLFKRVKRADYILRFIALLLTVLSALWFYKGMKPGTGSGIVASLYLISPVLCFALFALIPIFWGFINNYLLKVSCGTFFDEKRGATGYILALMCGFVLGAAVDYSIPNIINIWIFSFILFVFIAAIFLLKAEYSPAACYAQNIEETVPQNDEEESGLREDLFFSYLNFSSIVVYFFLAGIIIAGYYGTVQRVEFSFILLIFPFCALGFILPYFIKTRKFHYLYIEILYPFVFAAWFFYLYVNHAQTPLKGTLALFIPAAILFGVSIHFSIRSVLNKRTQRDAAQVLGFSLFILPVPILFALSIVPMTWAAFLVIFYLSALLNIGVPTLFNAQRRLSELRKGVYFVIVGVSVVIFVLAHLYFRVNFSTKPVIQNVQGMDSIASVNYMSDYITKTNDAFFNGKIAFHSSDQSIRSYKQAVIALSLFSDCEKDRVLFIDGMHPFFVNPEESLYKNGIRIDYVPKSYTGYIRVPITTNREIATVSSNILSGIRSLKGGFDCIVDIPNLYDQNTSSFRFTTQYYKIIKKRLTGKQIYAQLFDTMRTDKKIVKAAVAAFCNEFQDGVVFLFGETVFIVGSPVKESLQFDEQKVQSLKNILAKDPATQLLFFNELQCLSSVLSPDLTIFKDNSRMIDIIPQTARNTFIAANLSSLPLFKPSLFKSQVEQNIRANDKILLLLKNWADASAAADYVEETKLLIELRKYGEYNQSIRQFAASHLSLRGNSYPSSAAGFEKEKQWEEAAKIYRALIVLNPNDFESNYRMSVISLTLQDINGAYSYLQTAMRLQSNNPNVMHQMGVILFSTGKYQEAIEYLLKAVALQKYDAATYYYLAISYEELGRFPEAQQYYEQAIAKDPSNQDIISASDRLKKKIKKQSEVWQAPEQKNQNEQEKGENFPLPINKSAIDIRLKDEENTEQGQKKEGAVK